MSVQEETKAGALNCSQSGNFIIESCLPLLSVDRFNTLHYWLDVGQVLFNCTKASGLQLWIKYSAQATVKGRDKEACEERYKLFGKTYLTERTLGWYASQDDPKEYAKWHTQWCLVGSNSENPDQGFINTVAKTLWPTYQLIDVHVSLSGSNQPQKRWYKFDGIRLKAIDEHEFTNKVKSFMVLCSLVGDKRLVSYQKILCKDISKHELMQSEVDSRVFDSNQNLVGWSNGITELFEDQVIFRPGKFEDFVTLSTQIPFIRCDSLPGDLWSDPDIIKVMDLLTKTFPSKENRDYFLKDIASKVFGSRGKGNMSVWFGDTNSGKSIMTWLLYYAFGNYCVNASESVLKPNSSELTRSIIDAKLVLINQDINDTNSSIDELSRTMLSLKIIATVDDSKLQEYISHILFSKIRFILFESKFVEDKEVSEKDYRFKRDPLLMDRLGPTSQESPMSSNLLKLVPAFVRIVHEYFSLYIKEGGEDGMKLPSSSQKVLIDHDLYVNYIQDSLFTNDDGKLTLTEVYTNFKTWFKDNCPQGRIPDKRTFYEQMTHPLRLGNPNKEQIWTGYSFPTPMLTGQRSSSKSELKAVLNSIFKEASEKI